MSTPSSEAAIAALTVEIKHLTIKVDQMSTEIADIRREFRNELNISKAEVIQMKDLVTRWRGGFAALLGFGALGAYILTNIEKVLKFF